MKNLLVFMLCVLFGGVAAVTVDAQDTRTESMGGVGLYMHDYTNLHQFPATLLSDPMLASIELPVAKDFDTYSFGAHYQTGKNAWALYLNRPVEISVFGLSSLSTNLTLTRQAEFYFAKELKEGKLGVGLTFARDALTGETADFKTDETVSDVGIKFGMSSALNDFGVHFHLIDASVQEKTDSTDVKDTWGGYRIQAVTRFWLPVNEIVTFVPLALFGAQNTTLRPEVGLKTDFSSFSFGLGGGVNLQVTENNLVVAAVEVYSIQKNTADDKDASAKSTVTNTTFPAVFIGVESQIKPWLKGRFGVNQVYGKTEAKSEFGNSESKTTAFVDNFRVVFGFGLVFGNFLMDATFNEGLLFNGPNFISGAEEPVSSRLSITYNF